MTKKQQSNNNNARKSKAITSSARINKPNKDVILAAPVSVGATLHTRVPFFSSSPGGLRIRHREYLNDVIAISGSWNVCAQVNLNPGLQGMAPWLAGIAALFETYKIHKLKFCFQPALPTSTAGSLYLAYDYDPADAPPGFKTTMLANMSAVSSPVWGGVELEYNTQVNKSLLDKFTRFTSLTANLDIKTYDAGNLYVATEGLVAGGNIGNLFIEYDISLMIPQLPGNLATVVSEKIFNNAPAGRIFTSPTADSLAGNVMIAQPWPVTGGTGLFGGWIVQVPGNYLLELTMNANLSTVGSPTWTFTAGNGSLTDIGFAANATGGSVGIYSAVVSIIDAAVITFQLAGTLVAITNYALRVSKYQATLL
jgi:hypothetical protein